MANRYGTKLAGIEIYNEPNSAKYWGGPADPLQYTQFLCAGYRGAQAANVRVPIAGGSLAPNQKSVNGDMRMDWFLNAMFQDGAASCMDVISFHPYPFSTDLTSANSLFQQEFAQIRKTRDYWAPSMRLWVSETGLSLQDSRDHAGPAVDDHPGDLRRDRRHAPARRRRRRHPHFGAVLRLARLRPGPVGSQRARRAAVPPDAGIRGDSGPIRKWALGTNIPKYGDEMDFCRTLCRANIVLTMAMSPGRDVEEVQHQSRQGFAKGSL